MKWVKKVNQYIQETKEEIVSLKRNICVLRGSLEKLKEKVQEREQSVYAGQSTTGDSNNITEEHCEDLINKRVRARTGIEKIIQDVTGKDAGMILAILGLDHPASKVIFKYLVEQKKEQCGCMSFLLEGQKKESAT